MRILYVGAAGSFQNLVVRQLRFTGAEVFALAVETSLKDDQRAASGATAFLSQLGGVDTLILATRIFPSQVDERLSHLFDAKAGARISHVLQLSDRDDDSRPAEKAQLETRRLRPDVHFTMLRSTLSAESILENVSDISQHGCLIGSAPAGRNAFVDPRDVAAALAAAAIRPPSQSVLDITGPELLSYPDVAERLSAALGRTIVYQAVTSRVHRQTLLDRGAPPETAERLVARDAATERERSLAPNVNLTQLIGRPSGTLASYIEDHRHLLQPSEPFR